MKKLVITALFTWCLFISYGTVLPLRTQVSLNGTWDFTPEGGEKTTIKVPDFWDACGFEKIDHAVYERKVEIPNTAEWNGKLIKIEFDAVNFIADIYINNQLAGTHIGGYIPFKVDITKYVKAGQTFTLKVDVKGGSHSPIVDKDGFPLWPVGFNGQMLRWGIVFDVWMRAYGKAYIDDTYIQTSYRKKSINLEYTVRNDDNVQHEFKITGDIKSAITPGTEILKVSSESVTLAPGESKVIRINKEWNNPRMWSPADPHLYYLTSEIISDSENSSPGVIDSETRRFGFREVWTEGSKLMFNGHRFNILGSNIVQHSEFHKTQRYHYMTPESWNTSIDRLFELNLRTVRFHMQPAPEFIYDVADERGLLVMDESTIYAREYILKANKKEYLENCKKWIEPWVKAHRNHPSIVIWNAENEMGVGWLNWMTSKEMKSLGDEIRKYDKTRPVNYDGDQDVGDDMVNYHYIEGYTNNVDTNIYSWADKVFPDKPTGVGEFITHYGIYGVENQWWQGTWVRGMRYTNFADIRPYRHDWALLRFDNTPRIQNLINGLSPVALFDKEYDNWGIIPGMHSVFPQLIPGDTVKRTLILYNDEFEDEEITVEVLLKSSEVYQSLYNYYGERAPKQCIIAQGMRTYLVPLGEHIDIQCEFQVPPVYEGFADYFDLELITRKKGEIKFRETKRFSLRRNEFEGKSSKTIVLSDAMTPEY